MHGKRDNLTAAMDRSERFHKIIRLLKERRVVSRDAFLEALEVSRATFKRDLEYLRDRMGAPIVYEAASGGYLLKDDDGQPANYELPGLWLSAGEIHALLAMEQLLQELQPGLLGPHVDPIRDRIRRLIEVGDHSAEEVSRRIKVLEIGSRAVQPACFETLATALERAPERLGLRAGLRADAARFFAAGLERPSLSTLWVSSSTLRVSAVISSAVGMPSWCNAR